MWEVISNSVPISTLNDVIPASYFNVFSILFMELEKRSFNASCVEGLKKRPRKLNDASLSLYHIYCGPMSIDGITPNVLEIKLETLNIWTRYDFESYIMTAAIVSKIVVAQWINADLLLFNVVNYPS